MLTTGTAVSQLIVIMALPVLTRLYGPDEYGGAAVYASIVGLIVVIASLRYELAIPLPLRDGAAFHVVATALFSVFVVSLVSGIGFLLAGFFWKQNTGLPDDLFLGLIVLGTLTAGLYNVANYWAVRKKRFGVISRTRVQQGIAGTGVQLLLGWAGFGVLGLVLGTIIGQCAGLSRLTFGLVGDRKKNQTGLRSQRFCWAVRRYKRFPIYDSAAGLLNMASAQAPILLFAALFSPVLAGYYALAVRLVSAPNSLVGKAISQVLLPRIVEAGRSDEAGRLVVKLLGVLAWLSFFPFTVVALVANDVVPLAFGTQWAPAASVIAWTSVWAAFQFVTSPLSMAMIGLEALRLHTAVQLFLFVARVGAIFVGVLAASPNVAIIAFSVASVIGYGVYLLAISSVVRVRPGQTISTLSGSFWLSAGCAIVTYGVADLSNGAKYVSIFTFFVGWLVLGYGQVKQLALLK